MQSPAIDINNLEHSYDSTPLLALPSLSITQQEQSLILGPSGCGKSTLLHILAGLLVPTSGSVKVANTELTQLNTRQRDRFRGNNLGIIFQRLHLQSALSVLDNVMLAQFLADKPPNESQAKQLLGELGLAHRLDAKPRALSGGEAQRTAIARALINQPQIILADEPTSSLDDRNAGVVAELLQHQAHSTGATLVVVTHDQRLKNRFSKQIELPVLVASSQEASA